MIEVIEKQFAKYTVEKVFAEGSDEVVFVMVRVEVNDSVICKLFNDPFKSFDNMEDTNIFIEKTEKKLKIMNIMASYITEMEGYSYFGSNPGIPEDAVEDIAEELMDI